MSNNKSKIVKSDEPTKAPKVMKTTVDGCEVFAELGDKMIQREGQTIAA
jgi:hypothetical protein